MATEEIQTQAEVYGGRVVEVGDAVHLLPVENHELDPDAGHFLNHRTFRQHRQWLGGTGPFTITRIVRWSCGKIMLYLQGLKCNGIGLYASDLM